MLLLEIIIYEVVFVESFENTYQFLEGVLVDHDQNFLPYERLYPF